MDLDFIVSNNEEYSNIIRAGIRTFNENKHPEMPIFNYYRENGYGDDFGFYALSEGQVVGGINAHKKMQWLDIDILYINEELRKEGIGSKLINKATEYCKEEGLIGMHLYTLDFQAKGFYEKQEFELIAEIKDWPKGITRYEFIKYINNN